MSIGLNPKQQNANTTNYEIQKQWNTDCGQTQVKTRLKSKVFSLESWDIADMDKCPQEKCCMDKCHGDSCNLLYMFPGPFV